MKYFEIDVDSNGPLSLSRRGDQFPQERYLDLHGEPLYLIGNTCDTCSAIFERLTNDNLPLAPEQISQALESGLQSIPQDIVETVKLLLPRGKFIVALINMIPSLAEPRTSRQAVLNSMADYFWLHEIKRNERVIKSEIILPIYPAEHLNEERVSFYRTKLQSGQTPTALALSLVDVRVPMGGPGFEWTLAHFLLDGHHKVMAASQLSKPISILSFLLIKDQYYSVDLKDITIEESYGVNH